VASSVQPKFGYPGLRISYTCTAAVTAGQLVELTGDFTVGPAGAASTKVVGVALWDVPASRATVQGPQVGDGKELSVASVCVVSLTASGAIAAGDTLVAAAAGAVAAAGATPDARTVIGRALQAISNGN
jgi:hypothetical protein